MADNIECPLCGIELVVCPHCDKTFCIHCGWAEGDEDAED